VLNVRPRACNVNGLTVALPEAAGGRCLEGVLPRGITSLRCLSDLTCCAFVSRTVPRLEQLVDDALKVCCRASFY
jgi:hypothetical protein